MPSLPKCDGCGKGMKPKARRHTISSSEDAQRYQDVFTQIVVYIGNTFCNACRRRVPALEAGTHQPQESPPTQSSSSSSGSQTQMDVDYEPPPTLSRIGEPTADPIEVDYQRVVATEGYCFVCRAVDQRSVVPSEVRVQVFLKRRLFVPRTNRCCPSHLIHNRLYHEDVMNLRVSSNCSYLAPDELKAYMELLVKDHSASLRDSIGTAALTEEQMKTFTGLTYDQLTEVASTLKTMRNVDNRSVVQALVIFFFKLRTGMSNEVIANVFGLEYPQQISDITTSIVSSFEKDVLPENFGYSARTREDLIQNETSPFVRQLYGESGLALIFDGTYLRHGKSSNNAYQRKSYSGQKKTHLCKPFTICTTTGYVVDMLTPSEANWNDARIMKWALETGLEAFLRPGDTCFVDRGFRDVKTELEEKGFIVRMPLCRGGNKQFTAAEANETRFVTKIRWAVEAVHGIIKQKYRIFDNRFDNKLLPKAGSLLRIACYVNNKYGKRLSSDQSMFPEIVGRMLLKQHEPNTLGDLVAAENWNRLQRIWHQVTSDSIQDFPDLSERELKLFFTGSYQLSQSVSYLAEMLDEDDVLTLKYHRDNSKILKMLVQSRHSKKTQYRCYIEYNPAVKGVDAITRHYCECGNGARTVGCCSHVAAVVFFLSYARYQYRIIKPAEVLTHLFSHDPHIPVIAEESDYED